MVHPAELINLLYKFKFEFLMTLWYGKINRLDVIILLLQFYFVLTFEISFINPIQDENT